MKLALLLTLLVILPIAALAQKDVKAAAKPAARNIFPYPYKIDDFPNGLRLITIPTAYPNLVALYIVVNVGSRNEVEPGKSGYAHFFEHLMFRGSANFTAAQRDAILKRAGADPNAYTDDDRTVYHQTFSKEDLPQILELEADRFQRLRYNLAAYKTESLAVLGEYNKNSANPLTKMFESLRETAYKQHTYAHTTLGYLADIQDFPNQYDYSLEFYDRYYRPEYTTIVVVGDAKPEAVRPLVEKHFGAWKRGNYRPAIKTEPAPTGPRVANLDWPSATPPYLAVAFRAPAYSDEAKDAAALDLAASIYFGENSDLYQRLVLKEQKVDFVGPDFQNHVDPELFTVLARLKDDKDLEYVRNQILAAYRRAATDTVSEEKLNATRARLRYSLALRMNSSEAIADALAPFIALRRTPDTLNKLYKLYDALTPDDLRNTAARYFTDNNRTIVTLAAKK
jgi:zinc protease